MHYLFFYWIFSTIFVLGYIKDQEENSILHFTLMLFVGTAVGWIVMPYLIGQKIWKL